MADLYCLDVNQKLSLLINKFFDFRPYKGEKAKNSPHEQ